MKKSYPPNSYVVKIKFLDGTKAIIVETSLSKALQKIYEGFSYLSAVRVRISYIS